MQLMGAQLDTVTQVRFSIAQQGMLHDIPDCSPPPGDAAWHSKPAATIARPALPGEGPCLTLPLPYPC
jgi:hypothetical protein